MNYIRFTTFVANPESKFPLGIFRVLGCLENSGLMQDYEIDIMQSALHWFNKNLKEPSQFSRSTKNWAASAGVCWYKSTAHEHINKMYELVEILKYHDIPVNIIRSDKPGYIVFEDEYQIVAEPFNDKR